MRIDVCDCCGKTISSFEDDCRIRVEAYKDAVNAQVCGTCAQVYIKHFSFLKERTKGSVSVNYPELFNL